MSRYLIELDQFTSEFFIFIFVRSRKDLLVNSGGFVCIYGYFLLVKLGLDEINLFLKFVND